MQLEPWGILVSRIVNVKATESVTGLVGGIG
jgi:hypothetical protein